MTGMRTVADSLAHDLRSPLMRMRSALSRAQDAGEDESARSLAIAAAQREAERTLSTLTALLDIARAETGLSREMMRPVDLGALAADVADFFAPALEDADQTLTVEAPEGELMAEAHEPLLRQAIGNLLHNASQYAGPGAAVRLLVEPGEGKAVRIVVADTGHGVPEVHRGRVQERFVRLDPARGAGGSGLGLAIVAACAKLHGGALRLEDNAPGLRAVMEFKRV
jgi:signal transduction histidine kinase